MALLVAAQAALVVTALPAPAMATPATCSPGVSGSSDFSYTCSGGSGEFRVLADCVGIVGTIYPRYRFYTAEGPWVSAPGVSAATCKRSDVIGGSVYPETVRYETR